MSVKGFYINGEVQRYDYDSLDNKPADGSGGGITQELKTALLQIAEKVAYVDANGQAYYQALYNALNTKVLSSISAVFNQGGTTVYTTDSLDILKPMLTVTANYSDSTSAVVTNYTLTGSLTAGTSIITVNYGGEVDTFSVTVTAVSGVYTITNNLSNCASSNNATSIQEGGSYTATITASSGYTLTGATASVTMGGNIVTGAYSNGTISIANVTGDIVITVTAVAKTVSSIAVVYTQSGTVYDTDTLDSLRTDLVVTASYSDSTTSTVTDYTLSGTLSTGTSTITVSYGGKTATFSVTVTHANLPSEYQEVEYVEVLTTSTTGPYFKTGYRPIRTGDLVLEVDCMASGTSTHVQYPIGVASSASETGFAISFSSNGTNASAFNGESAAITLVDSGTYVGNRYYFTAVGNLSGYESITCDNLSANNTTASPRTYGATEHCVVSLFGVQKGNSTSQIFTGFAGKIYYAKITEDNVVRRQMIPCYRKSDNAPGFYDLVTQAFIGHTGDVSKITVGPNV